MSNALSVSRVVKVTVNLQPLAAARRNFGVALLVGTSPVIDQQERIRAYTSLEGVAADFGTLLPEYKAAEVYFSQTPRPGLVMIGRWVDEGAPAILRGAILSSAQAAIGQWTGIEAGELTLSVGGAPVTVDALDFSEATTLEGIAAILSTALAGDGVQVDYDGSRFVVTSTAGGADQVLGYGTGALAAQMKLTVDTALPPIAGMDGETALECVAELADLSSDWYGLGWAAPIDDDDAIAVAGFIQAAGVSRIQALTTTDTRVLDASFETDLASRAKALGYRRTLVAYSANPYAAISALARAFTVNFNASNSTLTLKFKQLPGIVAEGLRESQAQALADKRCNVFVNYDNDTAIFQEGVMAGDAYFDEIHGLDWLQNAVQTEVWNLLYQSKTKVPQTDSGINQIVTRAAQVLAEARTNGLIAPGVWNADGFGQLEQGGYLKDGYYLYVQRVDDQPQSEREQRKAPPIQIAAKLAGAVHFVDVQIDVNR